MMKTGIATVVVLFGLLAGVPEPADCVLAAKNASTKANHASAIVRQSASGPQPAVKGLDADGRLHINSGDRCPVCAMRVAAHPKFAGAIQLTDGRTFYFCGTGCLLRTWLHPEVFLGVDRGLIRRAVVQDYFTGVPCDAEQVLWVAGSDVMGPMGPALVPLKNDADLAVFKKRHGAKRTFHLLELDDQTWQSITGKQAIPQQQSSQ